MARTYPPRKAYCDPQPYGGKAPRSVIIPRAVQEPAQEPAAPAEPDSQASTQEIIDEEFIGKAEVTDDEDEKSIDDDEISDDDDDCTITGMVQRPPQKRRRVQTDRFGTQASIGDIQAACERPPRRRQKQEEQEEAQDAFFSIGPIPEDFIGTRTVTFTHPESEAIQMMCMTRNEDGTTMIYFDNAKLVVDSWGRN